MWLQGTWQQCVCQDTRTSQVHQQLDSEIVCVAWVYLCHVAGLLESPSLQTSGAFHTSPLCLRPSRTFSAPARILHSAR